MKTTLFILGGGIALGYVFVAYIVVGSYWPEISRFIGRLLSRAAEVLQMVADDLCIRYRFARRYRRVLFETALRLVCITAFLLTILVLLNLIG